MSYSESHHASIPYSGSVSYSYPPSEHGGSGTAHYSGNVSVNITINVNTLPFDGSVGQLNNSIDILTGSVVAMHSAQVAAIQTTATEVSSAIINGFFGTINSELSQQIQALNSAINAGLGLIMEQNKAVTDKNTAMENDYNRISSRYIRLFSDLDEECHKRIYALDKNSFNLSEKVNRELLNESANSASVNNLLLVDEIASSNMFFLVSSLNRKTSFVLRTLFDYISQESKINSLVDSFLFNEEIDKNISVNIPVIWSESDMLEGSQVNHDIAIQNFLDQEKKQIITNGIEQYCSGINSSLWKPVAELEKNSINAEFNSLAESCFTDSTNEIEKRIFNTMLSLWQNSKLTTL